MKVRLIFTVIREFETPENREELKGTLAHVQDEAGEFLYGGSNHEESIGVTMMVKPRNRSEWSQI